MNPAEIEGDIRRLELMLGGALMRREYVPRAFLRPALSDPVDSVLERYVVNSEGKMSVEGPPILSNQVPEGYNFDI